MVSKTDIIVTKRIETDPAQYNTFLDHAWMRDLLEKSPPALHTLLDSLFLVWKEAANTHRLPWLLIQQMEQFAVGFMRGQRSHASRTMDVLKAELIGRLDGSFSRSHRKKIEAALREIERPIRLADLVASANASIPVAEYWDKLTDKLEFQISITGSQSLVYCAQIFGYECFLTECFVLIGGEEGRRTSDKKFWDKFAELLGGNPRLTYWDDRNVKIAREARNSIVHKAGKAKPELLDESPNLFISPESILAIQPSDNHALFAVLKDKITCLCRQVAVKLAVVTP